MKFIMAIVLALATAAQTKPVGSTKVPAALDFAMNTINGKPVNLSKYQGKVVLIVNVASQCGFTPQYAGLEDLHRKYATKGLSILGFPANDFGAQEPGTNADIAEFCKQNYGVEFDMFSKIVVKGPGQAPLYKFLTSKQTNPKFPGNVSWNFEKFLIGRDGQIIARFLSDVEPLAPQITVAIEEALERR